MQEDTKFDFTKENLVYKILLSKILVFLPSHAGESSPVP